MNFFLSQLLKGKSMYAVKGEIGGRSSDLQESSLNQ